jgi:hypothetical protein
MPGSNGRRPVVGTGEYAAHKAEQYGTYSGGAGPWQGGWPPLSQAHPASTGRRADPWGAWAAGPVVVPPWADKKKKAGQPGKPWAPYIVCGCGGWTTVGSAKFCRSCGLAVGIAGFQAAPPWPGLHSYLQPQVGSVHVGVPPLLASDSVEGGSGADVDMDLDGGGLQHSQHGNQASRQQQQPASFCTSEQSAAVAAQILAFQQYAGTFGTAVGLDLVAILQGPLQQVSDRFQPAVVAKTESAVVAELKVAGIAVTNAEAKVEKAEKHLENLRAQLAESEVRHLARVAQLDEARLEYQANLEKVAAFRKTKPQHSAEEKPQSGFATPISGNIAMDALDDEQLNHIVREAFARQESALHVLQARRLPPEQPAGHTGGGTAPPAAVGVPLGQGQPAPHGGGKPPVVVVEEPQGNTRKERSRSRRKSRGSSDESCRSRRSARQSRKKSQRSGAGKDKDEDEESDVNNEFSEEDLRKAAARAAAGGSSG